MTVSNNLSLLDTLLARGSNAFSPSTTNTPAQSNKAKSSGTTTDIVAISPEKLASLSPKSSRLVSENVEKIDNGFRRTQTFETPRGGEFTRIEEQANEANRSKRLVIQQNESGSTTILENILDRQEDGTFRQTQRFTNEIGETSTDIKFNVQADNPALAFGLPASPSTQAPQPFEPSRGTQYNIVI